MHKNMHYKKIIIDIFAVTFREEGVDWNSWSRWSEEAAWTSPSARKVWIEIVLHSHPEVMPPGHLPRGRCGLKFNSSAIIRSALWSPSARKVWIEICLMIYQLKVGTVTFREEGVDWNRQTLMVLWLPLPVTFREEGVDWNTLNALVRFVTPPSPSARKVWIEIQKQCIERLQSYVTFREEGVDWNSPLIAVRFG